jgi:sulfur carrier protein
MMLNGETIEEFNGTVDELLATRRLTRRGIAVAVNGEVVPRSLWDTSFLPAGAAIEILTAAAGG